MLSMLLCETRHDCHALWTSRSVRHGWRDPDSVSIRRLRADGFSVIGRTRSRLLHAEASNGVNHDGFAIVTVAGIRLTAVNMALNRNVRMFRRPRRVSPVNLSRYRALPHGSRQSTYLVIVLYRTGLASQPVSLSCSTARVSPVNLSRYRALPHGSRSRQLLRRVIGCFESPVSTYVDPITFARDEKVHLGCASDPITVEFNDLASYRLVQVTGDTHDAGGTTDIVCTRGDLPPPPVEIIDIGLSDHRLLRWSSQLHRPPPVYT